MAGWESTRRNVGWDHWRRSKGLLRFTPHCGVHSVCPAVPWTSTLVWFRRDSSLTLDAGGRQWGLDRSPNRTLSLPCLAPLPPCKQRLCGWSELRASAGQRQQQSVSDGGSLHARNLIIREQRPSELWWCGKLLAAAGSDCLRGNGSSAGVGLLRGMPRESDALNCPAGRVLLDVRQCQAGGFPTAHAVDACAAALPGAERVSTGTRCWPLRTGGAHPTGVQTVDSSPFPFLSLGLILPPAPLLTAGGTRTLSRLTAGGRTARPPTGCSSC